MRGTSGEFDAMELINSKSLDLVRRPTASEVQYYSRGLDQLIAALRQHFGRAFGVSPSAWRQTFRGD